MLRSFLTLGTGEAIARTLYVFAFVLLARSLGKTALGQFGYALTVTSYLVLAVQQGIDQIAVRDVSRDRSLLEPYVRGLFGLRLAVAAVVYFLLLLYARGPLLLILGLTCFSSALAPRWAFQFINPRQLAFSSIIAQVIFFFSVLLVRSPAGIYWAAIGHLAGDAVSMAYLLHAIAPLCARIRPAVVPRFWSRILQESWPVSVSSLFGIVVYNFDFLALGWLAAPAELGLYLACYRCATVFSPLLSMLQVSILPTFARAFPDTKRFAHAIRAAAVPTVLAAAAVAIVFTSFPQTILRAVYGREYEQGTRLLQVLAWSLPLQGLRSILRQALLASHFQKRDTLNMALAAFTSVAIDLLLIPKIGPLACAISTVSVEAVLVLASGQALRTTLFGVAKSTISQ